MKVKKRYHHVYTIVNYDDWKRYWNDLKEFRKVFGDENVNSYSGDYLLHNAFITYEEEVEL